MQKRLFWYYCLQLPFTNKTASQISFNLFSLGDKRILSKFLSKWGWFLWLLKWCKIQSFLLYMFSLKLFIFSLILFVFSHILYIFSLNLCIFSQIIYIQPHLICFSQLTCIQSHLIYIQSTYMYSGKCYTYLVHIYCL